MIPKILRLCRREGNDLKFAISKKELWSGLKINKKEEGKSSVWECRGYKSIFLIFNTPQSSRLPLHSLSMSTLFLYYLSRYTIHEPNQDETLLTAEYLFIALWWQGNVVVFGTHIHYNSKAINKLTKIFLFVF